MKKAGHISQAVFGFVTLPFINRVLDYRPVNSLIENLTGFADFRHNLNYFVYQIFHNINEHNLINFIIMLFITIIGATIPDIDFKFKDFFSGENRNKAYLYHRQFTHSLLLWIFIFGSSVYFNNVYLFYFSYGILIHLIGDMLTGSIPILLWGKYYSYFSRIGIDRITVILGKENKNGLNRIIASIGETMALPLIIASILIIWKFYPVNEMKIKIYLMSTVTIFYFLTLKIFNFAKVGN